jgi:hypothetical protein
MRDLLMHSLIGVEHLLLNHEIRAEPGRNPPARHYVDTQQVSVGSKCVPGRVKWDHESLF